MRTAVILLVTHVAIGAAGFAAGIYYLPILTAPPAPTDAEIESATANTMFTGTFRRDLADSDALHWGEGEVSISPAAVSLAGRIAPGPDYKLYLSPAFIETETAFLDLKPDMARVGDVNTFENFIVPLPTTINPADYNTVVVWCESFGQFITAARYR